MIYSFVFAIFQAGMEQYQGYFNFYIQLCCFFVTSTFNLFVFFHPVLLTLQHTMLVYGGQWIDD